MSVIFFPALTAVLFIFIMTALGASAVFILPSQEKRSLMPVLYGFSAGVMLSASIWSLILPALEAESCASSFLCALYAAIGILSGMAFLLLFEKLQARSDSSGMLFLAITMHNIPEGMAVGLAFALAGDAPSAAAASALALGIGIQNIPEGAAVSLPLAANGTHKKKAFFLSALSGATEPVFGMAAVILAPYIRSAMPSLMCFAAGAMIFVTAQELIPLSAGKRGSIAFMLGFSFMMILDMSFS